jgi:hypothetical protein
MRIVPALATTSTVFLAACATNPAPAIQDAPGPRARVAASSTGAEVTLDNEAFVKEDVVDAPPADVWRVLALAWQDATIPIGAISNPRRTLQSGVFRAPSKIVGKPLSDYFDCGYTMAGPRVTLWQVSIDVAGTVVADPAGARVATRVNATARPRDGTSTSSVTCNSRGELERIIVGNVRVRLGG